MHGRSSYGVGPRGAVTRPGVPSLVTGFVALIPLFQNPESIRPVVRSFVPEKYKLAASAVPDVTKHRNAVRSRVDDPGAPAAQAASGRLAPSRASPAICARNGRTS